MVILYALIFLADIRYPSEYGIGKFYIGAIFIAFFLRSGESIAFTAVIAITLLSIGHLSSPGTPGSGTHELLTTRLFAALVICCGAWLAVLYRNSTNALERSESALRDAHRLARLGHFRVSLGQPHLECSEEFLRICGLEKADCENFSTIMRRLVNRDDQPRVFESLRRALRMSSYYDMEFQIVRPDGDIRDVRSTGRFTRRDDTKHSSLTGTLLDVSEWRRSERARHESELRMKSILDSVSDALIVVNHEGIIESFSATSEALFGHRAEEVIGRSVAILLAAGRGRDPRRAVRKFLDTHPGEQASQRRSLIVRRRDGSKLSVDIVVSMVPLSGQQLFTVSVRDLTGHQKLEEELRQAQKMDAIGQLTGGIAHDFNNLLTVIMGNLEILENNVKTSPDSALVREARETAELGAELTQRLLAFGRRQTLDARSVDLAQVVTELLNLMRRSLGEQVELHFHPDPQLPLVLLDPTQFQVALFNLVLNARDAMPKGGRVAMVLRESKNSRDDEPAQADWPRLGRYVVLSVSDTGTGMSETVRQRAMEPFFTTKVPGKGTGLGLSMVYGFAKQSNGHLEMDSKEGEGTTVRLYLPCAPEGRNRKSTLRPQATKTLGGQGQRILVVEDDARVRHLTVFRLKELGYQVNEAENGREALEVLATYEDVELLFSDYVMPGGMSGVDLARAARAARPGIKILLTTGYARPAHREGGRISGVNWLSKPYMSKELARAVQNALIEAAATRKKKRA